MPTQDDMSFLADDDLATPMQAGSSGLNREDLRTVELNDDSVVQLSGGGSIFDNNYDTM